MVTGTQVPTNRRCSVLGQVLALSSWQNSFAEQSIVAPGPRSQSVGGAVSTNSWTWAMNSVFTADRRAAAGAANTAMMDEVMVNLTMVLGTWYFYDSVLTVRSILFYEWWVRVRVFFLPSALRFGLRLTWHKDDNDIKYHTGISKGTNILTRGILLLAI
jgi:hypothetical protein